MKSDKCCGEEARKQTAFGCEEGAVGLEILHLIANDSSFLHLCTLCNI